MFDKNSDKKIKGFLLENKLITKKKLSEIEARESKSKKSLEEALIKNKVISSPDFNLLKGKVFNFEAVNLPEKPIDPVVLNLLPEKVSRHYQMVVFSRVDNQINVGVVNPDDFQAHEAMEFLASQQSLEPKYHVISHKDFIRVLGQYSGFKKEIGSAMESAKVKFAKKEKIIKGQMGDTSDLDEAIKSAPVAKIVSVIIEHAVAGGASDIHIEPGRDEGRVRYRVDGQLNTSLTLPDYLYESIVSRIKVMANLKIDETRKPQDGRIRVQLSNQEIDLRVSSLPTLGKEKIAIRIFDASGGSPTLPELGFANYHIDIIERNIKKPFGLFLLTGPTGSGKTTTLYSLLNNLNSEILNITTLEDPIEYYINGINQSQINPDVKYTFASGLRAILRQDPNVIMVGEVRDNETVQLVIHAGLTGHLVFSTLHTNDAWGAIPRLMDMEAEPFLLASTLNIVMAQRLVRRVCPDCKTEEKLTPPVEKRINDEIMKISPEYLKEFKGKYKFFKGRGCKVCKQAGYVGRVVIGEILEFVPEFKELIAGDFTFAQVEEQLKRQKFITFIQDGILKALKGITTIEEVLRISKVQ